MLSHFHPRVDARPVGHDALGPLGEATRSSAARTHTILVVDDSPVNLDLMREQLQGGDHAVLSAQTGAAAIACARSLRPDLILLDVLMPEMDGHETCRRLKADAATRDIPVIFMSGLIETRHKLAGFDAGAVDYITRPFDMDEVRARVGAQLALRDTQRRLAVEHEALLCESACTAGRLAATVAHEINTPVSFVGSNLGVLENHVRDVLRLASLQEPFNREARDGELAFLHLDIADLVRESRQGLHRVAETVRELVHFSSAYSHSVGWQCADLHRGLDSTLSMLCSEFTHRIMIERDYDRERVLDIECQPAQLNLAFMNLLRGAARTLPGEGELRIATGTLGEDLWVEIISRATRCGPQTEAPRADARAIESRDGGLRLSHAIIGRHQGRVEIGDGSPGMRWRVWLPRRRP